MFRFTAQDSSFAFNSTGLTRPAGGEATMLQGDTGGENNNSQPQYGSNRSNDDSNETMEEQSGDPNEAMEGQRAEAGGSRKRKLSCEDLPVSMKRRLISDSSLKRPGYTFQIHKEIPRGRC
jgi:hypothetical protein